MWLLPLVLLWQSISPIDLAPVTAALKEKRYAEALDLAQRLKKQSPQDARLWTLEGFAELGLGKADSALNDFRQAVTLQPAYLAALKAEAQLEYSRKDPASEQTLEKIVALQPGDETSHAMLGALAFERGDCPSVLRNYSVSQSLIQSQPSALSEYAQCLFHSGQTGEAEKAFRQAVALDPSSWQARVNLAFAELSLNQADAALATLQPAIPSNQPQVLDVASSAYEQAGKTPQAVQLLRAAIIQDPANPAWYLHFADLSFNHNSYQVGIDMLDAGLKKAPRSAPLYLARGVLFVQLGNYARAEQDFNTAAQLDPLETTSSVAQGLSKLQQSNLDDALAITRIKLKQHPQDSYLWYLKAETLRQKGVEPGTADFDEALTAAETAVRLKPDFPLAEDLLGTLYLRLNKLDSAQLAFEKVLGQDPTNESALYHLIVLAKKTGATSKLPDLMKRLAAAKSLNKEKDQRLSRYTFAEPGR